ncbi:MAG: CDC27 family protein [Candidatus Micrarchaeota archaeon]
MALGKSGYMKQIVIYLSQNDFQKAYELSREYTTNFEKEMISHFLFAKASFALEKYQEAALSARTAFNLSANEDDMLTCAVLASTAYFKLKDYQGGLELLRQMEKIKVSEELEELLFVFSLAMKEESEAVKHLDTLYGLNRKTAENLLIRFL